MEPQAALEGLTDAIRDRAWYPLFAYLFTVLIAIWSRWQPRLFEPRGDKPALIPPGVQWLPAVVLTGFTAFVEAFVAGLSVDLALAVTFYAMAVGGPLTVGVHRIGKEVRSPKFPTVPTRSGGALLVLFAIGLSGATVSCAAVKPVVRTIDDLARESCQFYFRDTLGISFEDAARTYCKTREDWAPFIDPLLRAQAEGGALAAEQQGLSTPETPAAE